MNTFRPTGFLNWALPLMLALGAIDVLLSGRDLSQVYAELAGLAQAGHSPVMPWVQRTVSLLLVIISVERIASHYANDKPMPSVPLVIAFVAYWLATVASPSFFGAHPEISHEYAYALIIGFAGLLVTTQEIPKIIDTARDALFVLMIASVLLVPFWPTLVLDESYTQGLLPGVPRLGGLAAHPVAMGMFAQTALLLLWARPYQRKWFNALAWIVGLGVLFFAQSKTAWSSFLICAIAMFAVRSGAAMWQRLTDPREGSFGILACLAVLVLGIAALALFLFSDFGDSLSGFFDTQQGAQLMTLTGRDQIWAVAWEEWAAHPWFGYGPDLFGDDFRMAIHMPNATNAHNQFMDTLARAGSVGATALVLYAIVLLFLSLRYAKRTGGLSIALFIAIALRSISEVPLTLFGYGTEFFGHMLLLVTLSAGASMRVHATQPKPRHVYGVPA